MKQTSPLNFSNSKVRDMLNNLYELFLNKFKDKEKAWDYFLLFIAVDNNGNLILDSGINLHWLLRDKKFFNSVLSIYDSKLLKSEVYDHLGELYFDIFGENNPQNSIISDEQIIEKYKASKLILDISNKVSKNVISIQKNNPSAIIFGVTTDLNILRIALTNSFIFGIKCFLLNADSKLHELSLTTQNGLFNWKFANQWFSSFNSLCKSLDKECT